ncbi:hypothetical protein ACN27F_14995 [Solwaraspora sp. WMMB335]|uniref:hypothetical protein n=1 Tax=Solwaraspora sp. WMMB335 TaxID=3404118 RepID=UPI003B9573C6
MNQSIRFVLLTTLQIAAVVILFAFIMTALFDPGGWSKIDWFTNLLPLLITIMVINAAIQIVRLSRQAMRRGRDRSK